MGTLSLVYQPFYISLICNLFTLRCLFFHLNTIFSAQRKFFSPSHIKLTLNIFRGKHSLCKGKYHCSPDHVQLRFSNFPSKKEYLFFFNLNQCKLETSLTGGFPVTKKSRLLYPILLFRVSTIFTLYICFYKSQLPH